MTAQNYKQYKVLQHNSTVIINSTAAKDVSNIRKTNDLLQRLYDNNIIISVPFAVQPKPNYNEMLKSVLSFK